MYRIATGMSLVTVVLAASVSAAQAQAPIYTTALDRPALPACATDRVNVSPCVYTPGDSLGTDSSAVPTTAARHSRIPLIFYGGLAAGLAANMVVHVDRDEGGYRDEWRSEASFPDKGVHALAGFALTSVGVDLKLSPLRSAITVCAAGAAFEATQGYVSRYDIVADCTGAAAAALWRHWRASR